MYLKSTYHMFTREEISQFVNKLKLSMSLARYMPYLDAIGAEGVEPVVEGSACLEA